MRFVCDIVRVVVWFALCELFVCLVNVCGLIVDYCVMLFGLVVCVSRLCVFVLCNCVFVSDSLCAAV